jgi:FkbM family methyltransferase
MEGIRAGTPIVSEIAAALKAEHFTLIDVGCSSGIDAAWREFGSRLRAFGFDPNLGEVKRLQVAESLRGVEYVAAFVGAPIEQKDAAATRSNAFTSRNPWARLSVARTLELRTSKAMSAEEKTRLNEWGQVPLADPNQPVVMQDFLKDRGISDVDFIKIDVDGADLLILRSLKDVLASARVLGVCIEVNYFGSDDEDTNTFHNVDRLLKSAGFELFDLTTRHYSMAALPAPYVYSVPAQSHWGRILQGDAIYFRDLAAPENAELAASMQPSKLAKLAALFAMFGLPDCAADLLVRSQSQLSGYLDNQKCLETLVQQAAPGGQMTYAEYMQEFNSDGPQFYPALHERVRRIWRRLMDR